MAEPLVRLAGPLGELLIRGVALLLLAHGAALLVRRASAATRDLVWIAAFVGLLALPASGAVPAGLDLHVSASLSRPVRSLVAAPDVPPGQAGPTSGAGAGSAASDRLQDAPVSHHALLRQGPGPLVSWINRSTASRVPRAEMGSTPPRRRPTLVYMWRDPVAARDPGLLAQERPPGGASLNRPELLPTLATALMLLAACAGDGSGGAGEVGRSGAGRASAALLEADSAFAAASAARGADAWAEAWASDGVLWRDDGTLLRGPDEVRGAMDPTLRRYGARFRWEPTEAAMLWPDSLGYTIGRWWIETEAGRPAGGEYLTAWVRRGGAWKVALDAPLSPCGDPPAAHAFDFWLGSWNVDQRVRAGDRWERYAATDVVTPTRHGCVIAEDWRGRIRFPWAEMTEPAPLHGASLRVFDPGTGAWTIFWIDDRSGAFGRPFVGRFEGPTGDFLQRSGPEGPPARRIRFRDHGRTVDWELAVRADATGWTPVWTMRFSPR